MLNFLIFVSHTAEGCPLRRRPQGSDSQGNQDQRCLGLPKEPPVVMHPVESWVMTIAGASRFHLRPQGNFLSVFTEGPGPLSP